MIEYMVDSKILSTCANDLVSYNKALSDIMDRLNTDILKTITNPTLDAKLRESFIALFNELAGEASKMKDFSYTLAHIVSEYQSNERKICNYYSGDFEIDSNVFDGYGSYGGNQGSAKNSSPMDKKELYDVILKYYPEMSSDELEGYLEKMNSEGCGYVALMNTIFASFQDRESEFKNTFGFSMYNEDGDLNYDLLLVDFYASTDNHNASWFGLGKDKISSWEDYTKKKDGHFWSYDTDTDITGSGTTPESQKYRLEMYLSNHNISVKVNTDQNITVENFKDYVNDNKQVLINYHYGNLYSEDGSVVQYIDGGHAMIITGVTNDGKYIVSSWGQKYYIDPTEILKKDKKKTWMDFSTISYNKQ